MRTRFILLALTACSGTYEPRPKAPQPPQPDQRSYSERLTDADQHDRRAANADRIVQNAEERPATERFTCGDMVLNDNLTTGGLRVTNWTPCFDVAEEQAQHERWVAEGERGAARHDRRSAAQLVEAEAAACSAVPARDRDQSVFARRNDIASIEPVRENDEVHGVRVVFKPGRGMSADLVRKDIACTRARWETFGRDPTAMPYDPTLVEGADVQVIDRGSHAEVVVLTGSTDAADVALARAEGQIM